MSDFLTHDTYSVNAERINVTVRSLLRPFYLGRCHLKCGTDRSKRRGKGGGRANSSPALCTPRGLLGLSLYGYVYVNCAVFLYTREMKKTLKIRTVSQWEYARAITPWLGDEHCALSASVLLVQCHTAEPWHGHSFKCRGQLVAS